MLLLLISIHSFQLKKFPLTFLIRLVCWLWSPSGFICLENTLSLLQFWRIKLTGSVFLVGKIFFLSALWIYHPTSLWLAKFPLKNPLIVLWRFPCMWIIFLLLFLRFSFVFNFWQLMIICFGVGLFSLISFGTLDFLNLDICFFLQDREVFSHYLFDKLLSLSSPSETSATCIVLCLMEFRKSLIFTLFHFFLLFEPLIEWIPLPCFWVCWSLIPFAIVCCGTPLSTFFV